MRYREPGGSGGLATIMVVLVVLVLAVIFRGGPRNERMRSAAAPAIQAIQRYAQTHGRYPASLAETGATAPFTPYGRYRYRAIDDGADCSLSVGSSFRDGFVLVWDCARGQWSMDRGARLEPAERAPAAPGPVVNAPTADTVDKQG
ncbi:MAG TPA: hypothetical protein VFW98_17880 [Gemmatimonadaceae bacterium]|nr:hypothetical protein [Gemmatimonadaceae bacterium]